MKTKPLLEQVKNTGPAESCLCIYADNPGLLHDTYFYGVDAKQIIPTFVYPTEVMDGAVVAGTVFPPATKTSPISIKTTRSSRTSMNGMGKT